MCQSENKNKNKHMNYPIPSFWFLKYVFSFSGRCLCLTNRRRSTLILCMCVCLIKTEWRQNLYDPGTDGKYTVHLYSRYTGECIVLILLILNFRQLSFVCRSRMRLKGGKEKKTELCAPARCWCRKHIHNKHALPTKISCSEEKKKCEEEEKK